MDINADIILFASQYIAHQCNCTSKKSLGLAKQIFDKYPWANVYNSDEERVPGTILVRGKVINMIAQIYPGSPSEKGLDTSANRMLMFKTCLEEIEKIHDLKSIAFPYRIGCGLAGGDWLSYKNMILNFAKSNPTIEVYICKPLKIQDQ